MPERASIPTDIVSILAFVFGAAVMIPAMISLGFTLMAVVGTIF